MERTRGFSLIELLIVVGIILLIASIAIPNLLRSRIAANEASATSSLRMLNNAEVTFAATYCSGYSDGLHRLGPPPAGTQPDANHADLIDPHLAGMTAGGSDTGFIKSGYIFNYTATGTYPTVSAYQITADPQARGSSGQRSYYTDQPLVIRANAAAPATATDTPI